MSPRIAAIIPTFNEVELLAACVESIESQAYAAIEIVVGNAGDPLPAELSARVTELDLPETAFWTACVAAGIEEVKDRADFLLFTNADTTLLPGTLSLLLATVDGRPGTIAASPAYIQVEGGPLELLYTHQSDLGPLLYGKLRKAWTRPSDAPTEPFEIDLTGGQGVLIPIELFKEAKVDVKRFPHYASDHDLWLQARRLGFKLLLVPRAGIVNHRDFNENKRRKFGSLAKSMWKRASSEYAPESWTIMWRLRRKHQGPILGTLTAIASFGLRWTIGLPKIVQRS